MVEASVPFYEYDARLMSGAPVERRVRRVRRWQLQH